MKSFFLFLTAIFTLILVGCGGGGGGSDPESVFDPNPTTPSNDPTVPVTVSAMELTASSSAIKTGETTTLTAILYDATGQLISGTKLITFSLDAPALGSIVSTGSRTAVFTARTIEGTVTVTATVDGVKGTKDIQISNQVAAAAISLEASPPSITIGGTSTVSALVEDGNGNSMPNGTSVNFNVDNPSLGTIVPSSSTTSGIALATFQAGSSATGTATITATSGSASGTTTINIAGTSAGGIEFLSAEPQIISIQGAGGVETSTIQFQVNDSNGEPIIGSQAVVLNLSGPNGGEYLGSVINDPPTTTIEVGTVNGIATTILHSGTIPGTATITATVKGTSLATSSGVIAIGGGIPSAEHFSLSADVLNLEGGTRDDFGFDGITDNIAVRIADRYGNFNVLEGTAVSFYSECGAIDRAILLDAQGQGNAVFRTQQPFPRNVTADPLGTPPGDGSCGAVCDAENLFIASFEERFDFNIAAGSGNPRDGICTIVTVVDGEEEFTDANADGRYNSGESFIDTYDDIHIDKDDDSTTLASVSAGKPHDPTFEDLVVDRNEDGSFDGLNDEWDGNKRISKRINLLVTGEPTLTLSTLDINVPHGGSQTIYFALHDSNYNRPVGGTTISAKVSGSGSLSGTKSYSFLESGALGTPILSVTISDSDPAKEEIQPVELEFSWTWKGNSYVLSVAGITN